MVALITLEHVDSVMFFRNDNGDYQIRIPGAPALCWNEEKVFVWNF